MLLGALAVPALPAPAFGEPRPGHQRLRARRRLDRHYSNSELRRAKNNLPTDLDEYSDCRDVIAAAIKGGSDKGIGAGSPGSARPTQPARPPRRPRTRPISRRCGRQGRKPSVDVGGTNLCPDSSGFFDLGGAANEPCCSTLLALIA